MNIKKKGKNMENNNREILAGQNRIYLGEDNILYYVNIGEIDEELAHESCEAMLKLRDMGEGTVHFLIDLNKGGKTSAKARKIFQDFTQKNVHGKLALCGMHPIARVLASFFMGITQKEDMRFFKTKEEALDWLRE